ncbi:MAG: hypothetical protein DMF84_14140 [Acidobacteria bacterium]|nr:MAG: hypothetical protein DMF84_14140 [Acidobacteriota bacterium]
MADVRLALRMLVKRPVFTLVAIITLAVGIGANTAIFSVVNGVLLRPLPYSESDRIVQLSEQGTKGVARVSHPNFADWRQRSTSFDTMAAYACDTNTVLGGSEPRFAEVCSVSDGFFRVFGMSPAIGRTFVPEELRLHGTPAVIVSHRFWERTLSSNADLSLLTLRVGDREARVVGVMPEASVFPGNVDVWVPAEVDPDESGRTAHNWSVVARLKVGVPLASAAAEMNTIAAQLKQQYGNGENAIGVALVRLQDVVTANSKNSLLLLLATVGLVLLIACANVATTLLARGEERRTEIAVRAALGASRARLVRQLLVESSLLGILGGIGGLLIAAWLVRALLSINAMALPRHETIGVDGRVMAFTLVLALLTPLVFGLVPSLHASRASLRDALAEGGRAAAPARATVRTLLVIGEVALALVLLVGAALLVRSFAHLMAVDPGFDATGVVTADMSVPGTKYPDPARAAHFYAGLLERIRAIPGVKAAGAANELPLGRFDADGALTFEGNPDVGATPDGIYDGFKYSAGYKVVTPGYLETLGMRLREGRFLADGDTAGQPPAAVVSETFVKRFLPRVDPIGVRFKYAGMDTVNPLFTIVGVVGDVHQQSLLRAPVPQVFVSMYQQPWRARSTIGVVARAAAAPQQRQVASAIRDTLRQYDSDVPVDISSLDRMIADSVADRRFLLMLVAAFAALALLLAATGIYSVLSQAVAQRTSEIGIRMALGADASSVVGLMLDGAMRSVGVGAAAGLVVALALARVLQSFLFEVGPLDPAAFGAAAALLVLVALVAAYVPARRATQIDPLVALRGKGL